MKTEEDDVVFGGGGPDWHNKALLSHELTAGGFGSRWWLYGAGYKEAADRLVAGIEAGLGSQDFLVYPILYLYRHYLEVMIKGQIRESQQLLDISPPQKTKSKQDQVESGWGHDLSALWDYLLNLVRQIHPDVDSSLLAEGTRVVAAFSKEDDRGDAFRYPETNKGVRSLAGIEEINLRRLRQDMERACTVLTQIEGILDYEQEGRQLAYEYSMQFGSVDY